MHTFNVHAVYEEAGAIDNCVGSIDGTVPKVARPNEYGLREVVYNGHKRKHALKFRLSVSLLACFFIVMDLWRGGVTNGLCILDLKWTRR